MGLQSIPLVFGRASSAPLGEWQPGRTSPFDGEGGMARAALLWPFLCPAVRSAGEDSAAFWTRPAVL